MIVAKRRVVERELLSPVLYVLDGEGRTTAFAMSASPEEIDLGDVILPARVQLVATGEHGPRPVAVLELGAGAPTLPARPEKGHFGLRLLVDFAREYGGVLNIASVPGSGTTITLVCPR